MSVPDEIDLIMAGAFERASITTCHPLMHVRDLRAALLAAGYRIELDPEFLLRKGRDEGVVLK